MCSNAADVCLAAGLCQSDDWIWWPWPGPLGAFRSPRRCLTISRGTTAAVVRLELRLERDGLIGRGETGGFETGHRAFALEAVEEELLALLPQLDALDPDRPQQFEPLLAALSPPARCAIDLALWDWHGQRLGHPLWRLWGLDAARVLRQASPWDWPL